MQFAVLNSDNIVVNIIIADDQETAEQLLNATCIPDPDNNAWIGYGWDGQQFEQPVPTYPGE